ncbi:MAG: DNA-binding protein WhiA [Pseudobutyrivibrio sp.]|nr:DNA-binding protein WhiA [Pseudobutyrivibrio sp.]
MSFSRDVKAELFEIIPKSRHCQLAELAGIITSVAKASEVDKNGLLTQLQMDDNISRKGFTLLNKTLNIRDSVMSLNEDDYIEVKKMLQLSEDMHTVDEILIQQPCCKRSFIRGAFEVSGSISDPNKGYHFEIVCNAKAQAQQLLSTIKFFDLDPKMVERNGKYVVYLKEGAQIVEMLRVMGAAHSVMDLENIRIVKEVRGTINRKVNCETANISKTVNAAVRQIEDIRLIDQELGLYNLPDQLQEIAEIRLTHPDTPLGDLGQYLDPPIGKSGVNHRLKKLSTIAESLR